MPPEIDRNVLIQKLSERYDSRIAALPLLAKIGVPTSRLPNFEAVPAGQWWDQVLRQMDLGLVENGLANLLEKAAAEYPGDPFFRRFLNQRDLPDNRVRVTGNIRLKLPADLPQDVIFEIIKRAKEVAQGGGDFDLTLGTPGSEYLHFAVSGVSPEQLETTRAQCQRLLDEYGQGGAATIEPYHFADYYTDPLLAEGPDGQRFGLDGVRASTTVKDVARGVMNNYHDDWPTASKGPTAGQRQQAVVDRVTSDGTTRLDPRATLHDAGVRPGDTLRVAPERTAGAVNPLMREEALARVRVQVLAHAAANPGFDVQADSTVAPTEYLFRFPANGFAPPPSPGEPPRPVGDHEVLVDLPPDFPIKAPQAWWQTEIFHPNVDPKSGWVCLGALQEHYRPGLDFGELCKMLVDIAAYRTYTLEEGHNPEAAQWALSDEGQEAIERAGGLSVTGRLVMEGEPAQLLKIRRLDR
jgi:hypothetical protein